MTAPAPSPPPEPRPRTRLGRLLREPLVHFLGLGAVLFAVGALRGEPGPAARDPIEISRLEVDRRVEAFERVSGRPVTAEEREEFVEQAIDDEIAYREALALGLDRGDTVIRERLREKFEFLTQDVGVEAQPTDADLVAFLAQNADRYREPARVSFDQVFVDRDRRGEGADAEVARLLGLLRDPAAGADPRRLGDGLPVDRAFDRVPETDVDRDFGEALLAHVRTAPLGAWAGPVESVYGWHLVRVRERVPGEVPALSEVCGTVEVDWIEARRKAGNAEAKRRLRAKYRIVVEGREAVR